MGNRRTFHFTRKGVKGFPYLYSFPTLRNKYISACNRSFFGSCILKFICRSKKFVGNLFVAIKIHYLALGERNLTLQIAERCCIHIVFDHIYSHYNVADTDFFGNRSCYAAVYNAIGLIILNHCKTAHSGIYLAHTANHNNKLFAVKRSACKCHFGNFPLLFVFHKRNYAVCLNLHCTNYSYHHYSPLSKSSFILCTSPFIIL